MAGYCIFCEAYKAGFDVVFESRYFFSWFDRFPVSPGHALVMPKRHITSVLDLSDEEWMDVGCAIKGTIKMIEDTCLEEVYLGFVKKPVNEKSKRFCQAMLSSPYIARKPDGYNIGVNEGEAAGKTVEHLHIHVIPRYAGDVEDPTGGIRHVIPGFARYM